MYRTLDDLEGRYAVVPPGEAVSLAEIHNVPYPIPDYAALQDDGGHVPRIVVHPGSYEYPDTPADAGGFEPADIRPLAPMPVSSPEAAPHAGISFADLVRTISAAAEPGARRENNSAPFWIPDDPRALAGPSFDDVIRTIDPTANPDSWRDDSGTPQHAGWDGAKRYPVVPHDPRAAALGAFRIPGLPEDVSGWGLRDPIAPGADDLSPVQLAARKRFNPGGILLERIWRMIGGVPGGRRPGGPPASAPSGRRRDSLGTPPGPSRNTPAVIEGRPYSAHALDSMQDRGIPPRVVEHTIRTNRPLPDRDPGVSRYFNAEHRFFVIVNDRTKNVITVKFVKE